MDFYALLFFAIYSVKLISSTSNFKVADRLFSRFWASFLFVCSGSLDVSPHASFLPWPAPAGLDSAGLLSTVYTFCMLVVAHSDPYATCRHRFELPCMGHCRPCILVAYNNFDCGLLSVFAKRVRKKTCISYVPAAHFLVHASPASLPNRRPCIARAVLEYLLLLYR